MNHLETNYIFFGTPEFAKVILEKLVEDGFPPRALVCNPDRLKGRRRILTSPPTKLLISNYRPRIDVLQPENLDGDFFAKIKTFGVSFAILAAYGKILPKKLIDIFPRGIVGVHPSLLPKYRGATPIQSALLNGDKKTGTSLFLLDKTVDHGLILAQKSLVVYGDETRLDLEKRLAELSAFLLVDTLPKWLSGKITPEKQKEAGATYTKKITTEDGFVDLEKDDPEIIYRKIKALNPEPGVFTYVEKDNRKIRLKILEVEFLGNKIILKRAQEEGGKIKDF